MGLLLRWSPQHRCIHDEWQLEVRACQAMKAGTLAVSAMVKAGEELGIRCPMTGEYKIGNNWSETH